MKRLKHHLLAAAICGTLLAALPSQSLASGYIIAGHRSETTATAAADPSDPALSGSVENTAAENIGGAFSELFSVLYNLGTFGSGS